MPRYFGALTMVLLLGMVVARTLQMKRKGIDAMQFGKLDKKDFLIPPFALFYLYTIFAAAFHWPLVSRQEFFHAPIVPWLGVVLCVAGLLLFGWSILSFGRSFRVGIDEEHPDKLITTGAFGLTRNPLYVAFWFVLVGQFLIFSNWILLLYIGAGTWLFHRQVLREEESLKRHYGREYAQYSQRVRRYL